VTPDGTHVFEIRLDDGARAVVAVLPEDIDEIAGPLTADPPSAEERQRRYRVARLLADAELRAQFEEL
jgi:hypothetical protein